MTNPNTVSMAASSAQTQGVVDYLVTPNMFLHKMNILIYGDPGVGKTWLAGTAQDSPHMKNVKFLDIDGGMMTLASRQDIMAVNVRSVDALEAEFWAMVNNEPRYHGVNTVVIDNISELQRLNIEEVVFKEMQGRRGKKPDSSIDDIYREDYGKSTNRMIRVLRNFRDADKNVIYIAHKKEKRPPETDDSIPASEVTPKLTSQLCTSVMGYMDFVWYMYTQDAQVPNTDGTFTTVTNRCLLTQPMGIFRAKTRGRKFAEYIGNVLVNVSLPMICDAYLMTESGG